MLTVKEVLQDKVDLDIECVDRVYLNGYEVPANARRCSQLHSGTEKLAYPFAKNDEDKPRVS